MNNLIAYTAYRIALISFLSGRLHSKPFNFDEWTFRSCAFHWFVFLPASKTMFTPDRLAGEMYLLTSIKVLARFYKTFIFFYVSEAKPLCFSLCSQMFDDVERCLMYNIQNVCHANEQLSLCYFVYNNVL